MDQLFMGKNILVVDDEPDLREILRDELEFAGANLVEAENGQQALELAKAQKFDAIISDIRMPGGDGLTLAKSIKSQEGVNPVMFLVTGFADVAPAEAYEIGVEGFIYKPFNLGPVIENLNRALLDPDTRWSRPVTGSAPKKLVLKGGFSDLLSKQQISIGRGGMFAKGSFADIRVQDRVSLDLDEATQIIGTVRWVQHESDRSYLPGLGIEFQSLNEKARQMVQAEIGKLQPKSYIPRK